MKIISFFTLYDSKKKFFQCFEKSKRRKVRYGVKDTPTLSFLTSVASAVPADTSLHLRFGL